MQYLGFPKVPVFTIEDDYKAQALKVLEEASEFVEAVKQFLDDPSVDGVNLLMGEAADVNQALMNCLASMDMDDTCLGFAALDCFYKNKARGRYE